MIPEDLEYLREAMDFFEQSGFYPDSYRGMIIWTKKCDYFMLSIKVNQFSECYNMFNVNEYDFQYNAQSDDFVMCKMLINASFGEVKNLLEKITKRDRASQIYNGYKHLISINRPNSSLTFLFGHLNHMLKDLDSCQKFLNLIEPKNESTDCLVHTLNALCSVRTKLPNWDLFAQNCHNIFKERMDEDKAQRLMGVIV